MITNTHVIMVPFVIILNYTSKNNENILIQGDSWAARLNNFSEHKYLSEYANKFNLGIINSGMGSYSISAMTVQLDIFENKLNIRPSIIIAIIDQSDLGDELYKYKKIDKEREYICIGSSF